MNGKDLAPKNLFNVNPIVVDTGQKAKACRRISEKRGLRLYGMVALVC